MFEAINNREVSDALFDMSAVWCREQNCNKLVGPMNLSTNHECGLLIEGFDSSPIIGIPYNPPYYSGILDDLKFHKAKDLVSLRLEIKQIPQYLESAISRLNIRQRFSVRPIRRNSFDEEIEIIWDIYNNAWVDNWGFVPMSKEEFKYAAFEIKSFIQSEYCFISEVNGEPAGFSITLPDINRILKKMNGRIFPLGWAKFLWNKNDIKVYRVVALGVKKKYRRLGIDAALYYHTYNRFLKNKIKWCDISWVLEDNRSMFDSIIRLGGTIYKRHRIYEKYLLS
jgi:GNAT superfamily N-acetyltransferase